MHILSVCLNLGLNTLVGRDEGRGGQPCAPSIGSF